MNLRTNLIATSLLALLYITPAAQAQAIPPADRQVVAVILWAESAGDPGGWEAKLNTYEKARRKTETLAQAMKRVSSAYRTKSKQYKLADTQAFNAYEQKLWERLKATVDNFKPDPNWNRPHHEKLEACHSRDRSFYSSRAAAIASLKKAWGNGVNYETSIKIGCEEYFELVKK